MATPDGLNNGRRHLYGRLIKAIPPTSSSRDFVNDASAHHFTGREFCVFLLSLGEHLAVEKPLLKTVIQIRQKVLSDPRLWHRKLTVQAYVLPPQALQLWKRKRTGGQFQSAFVKIDIAATVAGVVDLPGENSL